MQAELMYRKASVIPSHQEVATTQTGVHRMKRASKDSRETIHSGHFMVSDFEAEAQDDEDELAVPVPEEEVARLAIIAPVGFSLDKFVSNSPSDANSQQLSIETSLNKLFQCMSLAYRQKLTSPKWNRFKGIRLRWKDKIRLNNVIWRCWHMQFILKQNTLVCQFASPLDVDTHNKPEAVVLEGKYWKRKLAAVTAEYKKWRMFYRNKILGWTNKDGTDVLESMDMLEWSNGLGTSSGFGTGIGNSFCGTSGMTDSMMVDEDYMELMTDTLFSTITSNQPIYFPDPREIARGASLADFIQPSLGPLQPNLDDFMDTLEPLQEFLNSKLAPVPEEDYSGALSNNYPELDLMTPMNQVNDLSQDSALISQQTEHSHSQNEQNTSLQNLQYTAKIYTQSQQESINVFRNNMNLSDNFNSVSQNYEPQVNNQLVREKDNAERSISRPNRIIHQQNTYQQPNLSYQPSQQTYTMDVQPLQLNSGSSQIQLTSLNDNSLNTNKLPSIRHVQNLVGSHTYTPSNSQQSQPIIIKAEPVSQPMLKPYKVVQQVQQGYKFTSPKQEFNSQQCKFNTSNFKTMPAQLVVTVSNQQPIQPHILLQCKSPGLDLTQSASHPTKLLPRPFTPAADKEEVFAVPKYNQIKVRSRSRSSSSLPRARVHPPPLVSAQSDPALNVNNNVLLAHLLTNNTPGLYAVNTGNEKIARGASQSSGIKHILPMLPPSNSSPSSTSSSSTSATSSSSSPPSSSSPSGASNTHHITTPNTIQSMHSAPTVPSQVQQQTLQQTVSGQQVLINSNKQSHQSQGSPSSPKDVSSPQALSLSPLNSPVSLGSPLSPSRGYIKGDSERGHYKEHKRVGHIHAEQKRRYNIKNGFDMLQSLIPQLNQNPNAKSSKAAMLQKGADYIRQLRTERNQLKEEMDNLRSQIERLNMSISNCQSMLPATGAPVSRHRTSKMKEMFDEYVRTRTRENWKFWIFSILLEPLMTSFTTSVSTASIDDLYRSTIVWVEQHCSLVDLRPAVLNSLRYLCTATEILSDPARLPQEARAAVERK